MSYNDALLTDLDRIRSIIGDTDEDTELHSDEHITAVLAAQGTVGLAAAYLAFELTMRFANDPIKFTNVGGSYDFSHRMALWQTLAAPYVATIVATASGGVSASSLSGGSIRLDFQSGGDW
jgi:hypothetical protein